MRKVTLVCLALILATSVAIASTPTGIQGVHVADGSYENNVQTSTGMNSAKADTVYLIGGPGVGTGKFQNDVNPTLPDDEGWFGVDLTAKTEEIWKISTFMNPGTGFGIWAGDVYLTCGTGAVEGYGNNYDEWLDWTGTVADNGIGTDVTVSFDLNYDNEPGYDYLRLQADGAAGMVTKKTYNGTGGPLAEVVAFTVPSTDYVGVGGNEVHLRFKAESDGAWSDEDCLWPTEGLAQLDNIVVSGTNGLTGTTDAFESGMLGSNWYIAFPPSVGDFAKVWPSLNTLDPCITNPTPLVAFIDDGIVVPCTGGTQGITFTYGPGSFTHNLLGGCAGPLFHALNEVWSPVIAWDELGVPIGDTHAGARLEWDIYNHLPLANGFFYVWHVRSSDDGGLSWTGWNDRNFVYYGNVPQSFRRGETVTDLITNTPTHVQIALGTNELGWNWGFEGIDGTPAPYFDNVAFKVYLISGPAITTRDLEQAQDNFPAIGDIDYVNLENNSIRFDMADDIMGTAFPGILPGDSITYTVTAVAPGAVLNGRPSLHYTINANPLFDIHRTTAVAGSVLGDTVFTAAGARVPDRYSFDLPDEGMLFPGDVLHYYIYAEDLVGAVVNSTTLPGDLAGYGVFPGDPGYQSFQWTSSNIVRGLPTMNSAVAGDQPEILFYNDFGNRGGENEWVTALNNLGYSEGVDYDVYYTNAPSSGVSNGLGSRATAPQIAGYTTMLYTAGNLANMTLNPYNQSSDKSDDIALLTAWLNSGKNFLATGDNLVHDLVVNAGATGAGFVATWFGVQYTSKDISAVIGGQLAPVVKHVAGAVDQVGTPVGFNTDFIAFGACPGLNSFDQVSKTTALEIAEWTDAAGNPVNDGVTTAAAGFVNREPTSGSKVVYFPVDLMYMYTIPGYVSPSGLPFPARVDALDEILRYFGFIAPGGGTGVGQTPMAFRASNSPNPFNPSTKIEWTIPRVGDLSIKVFNVRGELVKTLVDGPVTTLQGTVLWNGQNDSDAQVASGVYFYEVRSGSNVTVNKMALVK